MTALTADRSTRLKYLGQKGFPVKGSTTIYKGSVVCLSGGYLVPAADTSGFTMATGIALEQVDNSSGSDGDLECLVAFPVIAKLAATGLSASDVGTWLYAADDQTVKKASAVTHDIPVGRMIEYVSATVVWVYLPGLGGVGTTISAADIPNDTIDSQHYAAGSIDAEHLSTSLKTGFIPLDITALREIASNDIQNLAAHGGLLASDSDPALARVDGATDKALRVVWDTAADTDEVQFAPVPMPQDLDPDTDITIHLLMAMEGTDDTPTVDVQVYDGVGDTEMGGATGAVTGTSIAEYSVTIANAGIAGPPTGFLNIALVPGEHTTDALYLYAAWIEYTRA